MPAKPPLTDPEIAILRVLMEPHRRVPASTVEVLSDASGLGATETSRTLRGLEKRQPPLVRHLVDEGLQLEVWGTTYEAGEAMEQHL